MPTRLRNNETGDVVEVSDDRARFLIASGGYHTDTEEEQLGTSYQKGREAAYSTGVNKLRAGLAGIGRGVTLGATDLLASEDTQNELQALKEYNPGISTAGEIVGAVAPALISGGAVTPAGALAKAGAGVTRKLGGGVAGTVAAGAFEGAAQNAAMYLSEAALQNKPLSAEGFAASLGDGALFGGAAGGAFALSEKALVKARDLFPRGEITQAAARTAEADATASLRTALDDSVAAQRLLTDKLNANKLAKLETSQAIVGARAEQSAAKIAAKDARNAAKASNTAADAVDNLGDDLCVTQVGDAQELADAAAELQRATETLQDWQQRQYKLLQLDEFGPAAKEELAATTRRVREDQLAKTLSPEDIQAGLKTTQKEVGARGEAGDILPQYADRYTRRNEAGRIEYPSLGDKVIAEGQRPKFADAFGGESRHTMELSDVLRQTKADYARQGLDVPSELIDELKQKWNAMGVAKTGLSAHGNTPARALDGAFARGEALDDFLHGLGRNSRIKVQRHLDKALADATDLGYQIVDGSQILDDIAGETITFDEFERLRARGMGPRQRADALQAKASEKLRELIEGPKRGQGDAMQDLGEGIEAFKRYEAAEHRAATLLGPDAPPGMAKRAQEYAAAIEAQGVRHAETATLHGEANAEKLIRTPVDDLAAKMNALRVEEAQLRTELGAKRIAAADARRGLKEADAVAREASNQAMVQAAESPGGKLANAGTALEVLSMLGTGIPHPGSIPLVGPLLGLWLKARAIKAVLGRGAMPMAATAEAKIAQRAAAVRSRVTSSVEKMLSTAERGVRRAKPLAPRMAVLSRQLWQDSDESGSDYTRRLGEIVRGAAPGAARQHVLQNIKANDPDLLNGIASTVERKYQFLASKAPKEPPAPVLRNGQRQWEPPVSEQERFARYLEGAEDPAKVLEDASEGLVSIEGLESVRNIYPELFRQAQLELIEKAATLKAELPYERRVQLSVVFQIPLDATMSPDYLASMQAQYAPPPPSQPAPAPSISADVNFSSAKPTPIDRISAR